MGRVSRPSVSQLHRDVRNHLLSLAVKSWIAEPDTGRFKEIREGDSPVPLPN